MEDILKKKMATFKMAAKLNISISQLVIKNKVKKQSDDFLVKSYSCRR